MTLQNLKYLSLKNNSLSGPLPDSWNNLTSLLYINLAWNAFNGSVPSTWTNWPKVCSSYLVVYVSTVCAPQLSAKHASMLYGKDNCKNGTTVCKATRHETYMNSAVSGMVVEWYSATIAFVRKLQKHSITCTTLNNPPTHSNESLEAWEDMKEGTSQPDILIKHKEGAGMMMPSLSSMLPIQLR